MIICIKCKQASCVCDPNESICGSCVWQNEFISNTKRASEFVARYRHLIPQGSAIQQHRKLHEMMSQMDEQLARYFYAIMELEKIS